jgi:hypothetical protein
MTCAATLHELLTSDTTTLEDFATKSLEHNDDV